jgi:outer membrane receptor protein involved in Fe transport
MIAALIVAQPAAAIGTDATLRGHVDGAASGATVTAIDTVTGHRTTATVDPDGNYIFLGLRPSTYRVEVTGRPAREATLAVGQTVAVDFSQSTSVSEVVVQAHRVRQEIVTQVVATNVTPAEIETLPQNTRNFLSFASMAPGIQLVSPSGAVQVQVGALSPDQTNVFIDGISYKNLTNHGGMFGQNFGQFGNPFPEIAIQEYQVETQSFGAETGDAGSGVINAITKTGGNDFHGSVFSEWQPKQFFSKPHFQGGPEAKYNRDQYGAELGGPIIKDKLTFYFAMEGTHENLPGSTGMLPASGIGYPANVVSEVVGTPHNFNFDQKLYLGKLTWYATDQDTVNLVAYIRNERNLSDIDGNAAITHARDIYTTVDNYQLNWKHSVGNLLNEFNLVENRSIQSTPTVGSGPEFNLTNGQNFNPGSGAELGAHFFTQADTQDQTTVKDDLTYRMGDHRFKAGGEVSSYQLTRNVSNAFNGRYFFNNPGSGAGNFDPTTSEPYGAIINTLPFNGLSARDTQISFYAEDEWRPDSHWTVNYGLRWDMETNADDNHYVTPANIVSALNAYTNWQAAGINPANYISNGHNRKPQLDEFQPRVGVSYDVYGDKSLVLFSGFGRYYDRSLFIEGAIEALTNDSIIPTVNFAPAAHPCGTAGAPANPCLNWNSSLLDPNNLRAAVQTLNLQGGSVWLLNNKTPAPYSDEFDVGVRKRFGDIQTSVTLSYVSSHNLFQFVRGNRLPNGTYTSAGDTFVEDNFPPCGQLGWNGVGWNSVTKTCGAGAASTFNGKLDIGESTGQAQLLALYVQVEKPFTASTRWGFVSSLTIQQARTNEATPSIFNNDEFFNGGSLTAYGWGNVGGVPRWIWNTSAEYRFPWDIVGSATLNLNSGPSFGNINFASTPSGVPVPPGACCYANFNGVFWPKDAIAYKRLDLRVAKSFKMPYAEGQELTLYFEGFNVFNWLNRTYSAWGAGCCSNNPSRQENGQVGNDQRAFQAGVKYKF